MQQAPRMGASFSADTSDRLDSGSGMPFDPVNNVPLNPSGTEAFNQAKKMAPDNGSQGELTTDSARKAVEDALNGAPFDPAGHPEERAGAQPMGPQLHQPPKYDDGTPSLDLPGGPAAPPTTPPPPLGPFPPDQAAPPPGPPPFMPPPRL
jgi:hypothetical protein